MGRKATLSSSEIGRKSDSMHYMTRREMLAGTTATALGGFGLVQALSAEPGGNAATTFTDALAKLKKWLADCTVQSRINYAGGLRLHTPCVSGAYKGIWPDDFLYPLLVDRLVVDEATLTRAVAFITDSVVELPCVPDRIEADGMPVMQPGGLEAPHAQHMPLHLPAAWVRLLDYAQAMGAKIPQKAAWARLVERSFDNVPFACGLAYVDPQRPGVGFGFHDPCAITGFELMSSLVLYRGLQRAAAFFADAVPPALAQRWLTQANGIRTNLHRLWSEEEGAYFAGSKDCRQVNVWANGLAYWLSAPEQQRRIVAWFKAHREKIFLAGYTRQIAEEGGWQRQLVSIALGNYTNGGFWSTGTGFVLPAIADQDAGFAAELTGQLVANMESTSFAEWIAADQKGGGAKGFLMGLAMPALGLQSIIEKQPLLTYF
jgi:hypothetical protein